MKLILPLLFIILSSCNTSEEIDLYNEYDDEWTALKAMAQTECIDNSAALTALKKSYDFTNYTAGDVFEYSYKVGTNTYYIYMKIDTIAVPNMFLSVLGTEGSGVIDNQLRTITFTETNAKNIFDTVAAAVCDVDSSMVSGNSLSSSSSLSYNFNPSNYKYYTDTVNGYYEMRTAKYYYDAGIPSLALLFNRTVTDATKTSSTTNSEVSTRETMTNLRLTGDGCLDTTACTFPGAVTACGASVTVDTTYASPGTETDGTSGYSRSQKRNILDINCP
jgi:hypothetical protein